MCSLPYGGLWQAILGSNNMDSGANMEGEWNVVKMKIKNKLTS